MPRSSHEEFYAQSFIRLLCFLQNPPGGAASPLPDSSPHGQRGRCPSHVAKSCAKLSKQISRNHCPTSYASYTSYCAIASAKHKASHSTATCKARSSVKWGCALRVVERLPLFCNSVVKDQIGSFPCHFPSAQAHLQSERSL